MSLGLLNYSVFGAEVVPASSFPCVLCALAQLQLRFGVCVLRGAKGACLQGMGCKPAAVLGELGRVT